MTVFSFPFVSRMVYIYLYVEPSTHAASIFRHAPANTWSYCSCSTDKTTGWRSRGSCQTATWPQLFSEHSQELRAPKEE